MQTSSENFMCYVFHVEPSAAAMAKMIEAACKLRYQKVLDAHASRHHSGMSSHGPPPTASYHGKVFSFNFPFALTKQLEDNMFTSRRIIEWSKRMWSLMNAQFDFRDGLKPSVTHSDPWLPGWCRLDPHRNYKCPLYCSIFSSNKSLPLLSNLLAIHYFIYLYNCSIVSSLSLIARSETLILKRSRNEHVFFSLSLKFVPNTWIRILTWILTWKLHQPNVATSWP